MPNADSSSSSDEKDVDYKWWIPITFLTEKNPDFTKTTPSNWLPASVPSIAVSDMPTGDEWVIFNIQQMGYFRVQYEASNWEKLSTQLTNDFTVIHVLNRAQLIDDAFYFAQAQMMTYDTPMNLISYLGTETEYVPWYSATYNLAYVEEMFTRKAGYGPLKVCTLTCSTIYFLKK